MTNAHLRGGARDAFESAVDNMCVARPSRRHIRKHQSESCAMAGKRISLCFTNRPQHQEPPSPPWRTSTQQSLRSFRSGGLLRFWILFCASTSSFLACFLCLHLARCPLISACTLVAAAVLFLLASRALLSSWQSTCVKVFLGKTFAIPVPSSAAPPCSPPCWPLWCSG